MTKVSLRFQSILSGVNQSDREPPTPKPLRCFLIFGPIFHVLRPILRVLKLQALDGFFNFVRCVMMRTRRMLLLQASSLKLIMPGDFARSASLNIRQPVLPTSRMIIRGEFVNNFVIPQVQQQALSMMLVLLMLPQATYSPLSLLCRVVYNYHAQLKMRLKLKD
jgi:hypothetical protein